MEKITRTLFISYLEELHNDAKCALEYNNDFELLIAIMLSAQTTDKKVNLVTRTLFNKYPNLYSLSTAEEKDIEEIIKSLGLYKNKTKNIISASKKLVELGYDNIPDDFETLISLDGVGRKTANVFLSEYYDKNTLGVDTHILRVSKRLRITGEKSDALKCEQDLMKFVKDYNYKKLHHMMIQFGRCECKAINPFCQNCKIKMYCKNK
ncbi:endonuclease III [bacterium]|nr:endonuclease III [bacterium]